MSNTESKTESKTRGFDGNINAALLLLDRAISTVDDFVEAGHIPSDDELEEYLADVRIELIAWVERKCVPADNWIPIEDTSQLKNRNDYSIQLKAGSVIFAKYLNSTPQFVTQKNYYELDEVLCYQPLPEAKT